MDLIENLTVLTTKHDRLSKRLAAIKQAMKDGCNCNFTNQIIELEYMTNDSVPKLNEVARLTQIELVRIETQIARLS